MILSTDNIRGVLNQFLETTPSHHEMYLDNFVTCMMIYGKWQTKKDTFNAAIFEWFDGDIDDFVNYIYPIGCDSLEISEISQQFINMENDIPKDD